VSEIPIKKNEKNRVAHKKNSLAQWLRNTALDCSLMCYLKNYVANEINLLDIVLKKRHKLKDSSIHSDNKTMTFFVQK